MKTNNTDDIKQSKPDAFEFLVQESQNSLLKDFWKKELLKIDNVCSDKTLNNKSKRNDEV